jgi:hypothetical protein
MNIYKILEEIYKNKQLERICLNVARNKDVANWMMSEITIKLIENKPPQFLNRYENGTHLNYLAIMAKNEYVDEYSQTNKNYFRNEKIFSDYEENEYKIYE